MVLDTVARTIDKFSLFRKGDKVIIGVSGGPDSVVLTHLLHALRNELRLTLHIAHLDHGLRKISRSDSAFVQRLGESLGIPVSVRRLTLAQHRQKGSLEEIARRCRFEFFGMLAKKIHADKIALGHTLDDQAETVLMRLLRGSGLYGLAAILPKRAIEGLTVVRPLIETTRRDIETYLKKRKLAFRVDSSNFQEKYFRNRIRLSLLPLLERKYNRNIKRILAHTAGTIALDYDYLHQEALKKAKKITKRIALQYFLRLHPAMKSLLLRVVIARCKGDTRRLGYVHWEELQDLITRRPLNSVVDLPGGISAAKKGKYLYFYSRKTQ